MAYYMDEQLLVDTGCCQLLSSRKEYGSIWFHFHYFGQDDQLCHHFLRICKDCASAGILLADERHEAGHGGAF